MMQLGRVRLGEKGPKGEPRKRATFRFTSASKSLLDAVAGKYGGTVEAWQGAPDDGFFEVGTEASEIGILFPPVFSDQDGTRTAPISQAYELWSGGGCQRRCNGEVEVLTGKPCLCNPADRACEITTRLSFMIPDVPGLGVWRLDTKGWNAAVELPGTLDVLLMAAADNQFIPAVLRIEQRTKKVPGEGTRRFVVPVIDLPQLRLADLIERKQQAAINAPAAPPPRPALPPAQPLPADPAFNGEPAPAFGEAPPLPAAAPAPQEQETVESVTSALLEVTGKLGAREATEKAIARNRAEHAGAPEKHLAWLRRQLRTAQTNLVARQQNQGSEFERMAAEAQARAGAAS